MPRFYFRLYDSAGSASVDEDCEVGDLRAAHAVAIGMLKDRLKRDAELRSVNLSAFVDVEDAAHFVRLTVSATEAIL